MNSPEFARRLLTFSRHIKKIQQSRLSSASPQIELSSTKVQVDEKFRIKIKGLGRGQKITLQALMKESEKYFGACGHYTADGDGQVDTFSHSSQGGTYDGVEPMGLFWSMKTTPEYKPGRIVKDDVTKPFHVKLAVQDGFQEFNSLPWKYELSCLASIDCYRHYLGSGVKRIPVSENGVYGTLFLPEGDGPFPAVIDIFGMTGGILEFRSALLASHGVASFAIGYVNYKDLPKNEMELDFNYFLKAFDYLANHPSVDPKRLGGISTCVGGGYLQMIGAFRPNINCLVCINGTGVPIGKIQKVEGMLVKAAPFRFDRVIVEDNFAIFREMFNPNDDYTMCPGYQHGAKVLYINGGDDQCVHPDSVKIQKLNIPDKLKPNCSFLFYPGAGHLLEPPYAPLCRANFNSIFKMYLLWGGETKLHAKASEDCWPRIIDFLKTNLHRSQKLESYAS